MPSDKWSCLRGTHWLVHWNSKLIPPPLTAATPEAIGYEVASLDHVLSSLPLGVTAHTVYSEVGPPCQLCSDVQHVTSQSVHGG